MPHRLAFTLIELLVVITILVILMALIGRVTLRDQRGAQVRGAAEELVSVLRRTRHRAISERRMYGVSFNIQNEPGSSGAVLNNRSGGHWYRVIGPSLTMRYIPTAGETVPWAGGQRFEDATGNWNATNFPDFSEEVAHRWASEPYVLPARKVRFVALGDTDEGPRRRLNGLPGAGNNTFYNDAGETTYPRPWFGFFDASTGTLWPWGGYDPAKPASGFHYQGDDGPVIGCRNPVTRTVNQDWNGDNVWSDQDRNGDGDFDDPGERELNWPLATAGEPRPLVNAAWLDAVILFMPDGHAEFGEWNRGRRAYDKTPDTSPAIWDNGHNGVSDRCKPGPNSITWPTLTNQGGVCPYEIGEVAHFVQHTGGWYITLAPDILEDRTQFPSAKAALETLRPAWRVHVHTSGVISAAPVMERSGYVAGLKAAGKAWPANPTDWLDTSGGAGNQVWANCRLGWLHQPPNPAWDTPSAPLGMPISDIVDPDMLSERIWWRLP
jgi:prepilin-type N-terminal cleavage/methylation domain-containing protein